ncbi:response regulator transcription factor [[Clostridium] symbiosum]|uniref:response regulator transcription factor n=1 Tax=Clostridium symbiosum TaxID=1512 RepID=UPI002E8E2900|nr:helix-turn-helix domain-containing protein [[Clostridium] symbiosum]
MEWERLSITALFEAENGIDALEIIESLKPDIMILDIRMPGMDGVALLEELCRRKYDISVIGLSGYSDFDAARKMLSSGKVVEYLLKPVSADALFEAVTRCLEKIGEREQLHLLHNAAGASAPMRINLGTQEDGEENEDRDGSAPAPLPPEVNGRKGAVVRLAREYIDSHYGEKLTLEQIAARVYINPSYLSRIFTEVEGIGLNKYLQKIRIEKAKELLQNPAYKVYEVADLVGYPNFQHFLKIFKKLENTTPSKYRENTMWLIEE